MKVVSNNINKEEEPQENSIQVSDKVSRCTIEFIIVCPLEQKETLLKNVLEPLQKQLNEEDKNRLARAFWYVYPETEKYEDAKDFALGQSNAFFIKYVEWDKELSDTFVKDTLKHFELLKEAHAQVKAIKMQMKEDGLISCTENKGE